MSVSPDLYHTSSQKRALDLIIGIIFLFFTLPVMLLIGLLILLTSGVPIFYTQKRTGYNKKTFLIYKFRTMKNNADQHKSELMHLNQAPAPMFKMYDDPRLTNLGKNLYQLGLDELPQLINIMKGDMSLVGPRPLPIKEANKLSPGWDFRYQVKPGLFSFWTLDENRHKSLKTWKNLEKKTIDQGSIFLDIKIILKNTCKQLSLALNKFS